MSTVTIDEATAARLRATSGRAEIRDAAGNVVGFFRPPPRVYQEGQVPEVDEAELKRRFRDSERISTSELLRRLEKR